MSATQEMSATEGERRVFQLQIPPRRYEEVYIAVVEKHSVHEIPTIQIPESSMYFFTAEKEDPNETICVYVGIKNTSTRFQGGHSACYTLLKPEYCEFSKYVYFARFYDPKSKEFYPQDVQWSLANWIEPRIISHMVSVFKEKCINIHWRNCRPDPSARWGSVELASALDPGKCCLPAFKIEANS